MIFLRFNCFFNISINFLNLRIYFWYNSNNLNTYSVLNKFDLSTDFDDNLLFSLKNNLNRLIYIKKKFGFFKKDNKINHFYLYKTNFLKNSYNSKIDFFDIDYDNKTIFNKFIDLKSTNFNIFYKNRKILKNLILFKNLKQKKTTKFFSKILKLNFTNFSKFIEFSIYNLLIKSKICYTISESLFLIKNGFVFLNGVKLNNPFLILKKTDIVQISISDSFFDFFKINTDKKFKLTSLLKHIIWKNNRFVNNFYKQSYSRVPNWVNEVSSYYEDIPSYIEIDYTVLSFCFLNDNLNFFFYNNSFLNFINIFMIRNYNWNYLI